MSPYNLYIHIPFCKQRCSYCDFHFSTDLKHQSAIVAALIDEIRLRKTEFGENKKIASIYFGGGTPSLLTQSNWLCLFDALHTQINTFDEIEEITIEANPEDMTPSNLYHWLSLGVNRLSVGLQTMSNHQLKWMNRLHSTEQSLKAIKTAQDIGFDNMNVDYMMGIPDTSLPQISEYVNRIIQLNIQHISAYILTVEPKTQFYYQIKYKQIYALEEEVIVEQFKKTHYLLEASGFEHYEISNYAQTGKKSIHNSSYWKGNRFIGIGPSAHSFDGLCTRKKNVANNTTYLKTLRTNTLSYTEEKLDNNRQYNEYIMIQLRIKKGLDLNYIKERWGMKTYNDLTSNVKEFIQKKWIIQTDNYIKCTLDGWLFSDYITAALFI